MKIFILITLLSQSVMATQVPGEWLGLPGNKNQEGQVDNAIDEILNLHKDSLEDVSSQKRNGSKYFLGGFITSFGVSAGGTIGVLGLSGNSSASLVWAKQVIPETPLPEVNLIKSDIIISPETPKEVLTEKIQAISEVLVKSRKVNDEEAVKKNLLEAALNFQKSMEGINLNLSPRYLASGFAVVFGISATGRVNFGTVGGGVTVTLEWKFGKNPAKSRISRDDFSQKINDLANTMAEDISVASQRFEDLPQYKIKDIWVGVVFKVNGNVGVASLGGQVGGYLIFTPSPVAKLAQNFSDKGEIPVSDNLKFKKVARKKIRKGLDLAFRIGARFAKRAQKHQEGKWKILLITTNYSLGLSGNVGIATVSASPTIKVNFINTKF